VPYRGVLSVVKGELPANKQMVLTTPAHCSFQHNCPPQRFGGGFGVVLPVRALAWPHI